MLKTNICKLITTFSVVAGGFFLLLPAAAQDTSDEAATEIQVEEELIVVGSRVRGRSETESPVPVDVVQGDDFVSQGVSDLDAVVSTLVPSYVVAQEPISDAATVMRPASLRGMSPDATMVLINSKRRHRGAVIALLGSGLAGGSQAPDLSSIPAIAIDRLEVLRDGASAQYGSDAIAGIMNFVLRSDNSGALAEVKTGSTFEGDGSHTTVAGNIGLPILENGFLNLSGEYKIVDPTDRAVQRGDAQDLIDAGNTHVRTPHAMVWGGPEIRDDIKLFANFGIDLSDTAEAYGWANNSTRTVEGGFYYRNPNTRNGVFNGPSDVSYDPATNMVVGAGTPGALTWAETVRVANLNPSMGGCGANTIQDPESKLSLVEQTADADYSAIIAGLPGHCFMMNEVTPGGFTPQFGGDVTDTSFAIGIKGTIAEDVFWDLSFVTGSSEAIYFINNTVNPQTWAKIYDGGGDPASVKRNYMPGTYKETDTVINFDLSKPIEVGFMEGPLNVAAGLESRSETFEIVAGEIDSWFIDSGMYDLASQGFGVGSNGFPGFPESDAGERTVDAWAAYVDLEGDVTDALKLGAALRYEDYDTIGTTLDWKLTGRVQMTEQVAFRGAISTGFRVPTAGQSNLRNVTTEFTGGKLADIATLPPTNPVAIQKGAIPLEPEESTNVTLGAVWSLDWADVTLDYYRIRLDGRIAFTSRFNLEQEDIDALLAAGVSDATSFSSVRYFSNQQNAVTSGVDLVFSVPFEFMGGDSKAVFAGNWNGVVLEKFDPKFTSQHLKETIEKGKPKNRMTATWFHTYDDWSGYLRLRRYGTHYDATLNSAGVSYYPNAATLVDLEIGRQFTENLRGVFGIENALDHYPSDNPNGPVDDRGAGGASGLIYPEHSPYGFLGGKYYLRVQYQM